MTGVYCVGVFEMSDSIQCVARVDGLPLLFCLFVVFSSISEAEKKERRRRQRAGGRRL